MNEKKILFVTNTIQTMSGASKVMRFVASGIAKTYPNIDALILFDDKILNKIEGVRIHTLGINTKTKLLWRFKAIKKIRREIKRINPDIICTFVSDACFMTRISTLGTKRIIVSCDRGDPSWREGSSFSNYLWDKGLRWTYKHSNICVFQLPEVRDYFGEKNLKKTFVIANPFVPTVEPSLINKRKKTIVSAGRFTNQKGYDVLIDAFSKVYAKYKDYELFIYGDGELKEEYIKQIKTLGLEKVVHLPGFIKNVSEKIKEDGIFVLSSRYEGIPNSMLEALSMGLPCVATDCSPGGAKFLSDGERRAIIVPIDDSDAMAKEICRIIENKEIAESLSNNAIQVRTEFEPEVILEKWKIVFESCGL